MCAENLQIKRKKNIFQLQDVAFDVLENDVRLQNRSTFLGRLCDGEFCAIIDPIRGNVQPRPRQDLSFANVVCMC